PKRSVALVWSPPAYCSSPPWRCCRVRDLHAIAVQGANYERRHRSRYPSYLRAVARNRCAPLYPRLRELYAEDAILESPLTCAVQPVLASGLLRRKPAIGDFFTAVSRTPSNGLSRWYRTGHFFANGRQLT